MPLRISTAARSRSPSWRACARSCASTRRRRSWSRSAVTSSGRAPSSPNAAPPGARANMPAGPGGQRVPRFIAFEGIEGCGKSTQIRLLSKSLEARGVDHVLTREPGGTSAGEGIRRLVLDPATALGPWCELLLYAAARAQHLEEVIRPALEGGRLVLCDRYLDATRA